MFSKSKKSVEIDREQYEFMKNAEKRVKSKRKLFRHFIIFILGSALLFVLNKVFHYGENYFEDWFLIAITLWAFLFLYHAVQVFILNPFMGKEWEKKQMEKLVALQNNKVEKMKADLEKEAKLQAESEMFSKQLDEIKSKTDQ